MAYSEKLAERIRGVLDGRFDVEEKKMFGGLCFMVAGSMACGVMGDDLLARVGPAGPRDVSMTSPRRALHIENPLLFHENDGCVPGD